MSFCWILLAAFLSKEMSAVLRREQYTVKICLKYEQHEHNACVTQLLHQWCPPPPNGQAQNIPFTVGKPVCIVHVSTFPGGNLLKGQAAWDLWWTKY